MKFILSILMIALANECYGQIEITGKVKSSFTGKAIAKTIIKDISTGNYSISNKAGHFKLVVQQLPCKLSFTKDCYLIDTFTIKYNKKIIVPLSPKIECDTSIYLFK